MWVLGVIAARGGSKGLPGKNLRPLGGVPLIGWSIRAAKESRALDRCVVSTDDDAIAAAARDLGGDVPFKRPAELATHTAGMVGVLQHAVRWLEQAKGRRPDAIVLLQATSPLRAPSEIDATVELVRQGADSSQTVTEDETHPLHRFELAGSRLEPLFVDPNSHGRRQDGDPIYRPTASVYAIRYATLMEQGRIHGQDHRGLVCPFETSVDIDDLWDFRLAELILQQARRLMNPLQCDGPATTSVPMSEKPPRREPFVIAEAGVNHNGDAGLAVRLVDAAADAGADAVKFQTFQAAKLASAAAPKARYQRAGTSAGGQLDMLRRLELSKEGHRAALARAKKRRIEFLSTPFDEESADFLEDLGVARFKMPSGELTNLLLLRHVARKGRPIVLSTGMGTLEEVRAAVDAIRAEGDAPITLLHCVSAYPAAPADANLRAMKTLADAFGLPVGFSDHTPGLAVGVAAAALGATVIEKHFTLDKSLPGPDHAMSLDPAELAEYVRAVRSARAALGDGRKAPRPCEREIRRVARRSIVLRRPVKAGTRLTAPLLALKRPGTGIPPSRLDEVLGRTLAKDAAADTLLRWEMLR